MINVKMINNAGSGMIDQRNVNEGTSLGDFLREQVVPQQGRQVTVNQQTKTPGYHLQDGDVITVTPTNVKGG